MSYAIPALGTAGQVYTAVAHNIIVEDILVSRALQLNVKSTTLTSALAQVTSASYADIVGLTVSITPSTVTSKILVVCAVALDQDAGATVTYYALAREGVVILQGDAAGSRVRAVASAGNTAANLTTQPVIYLDSPATISTITYSIQVRSNSGAGTAYVNRAKDDTDSTSRGRGVSTITVIEVPA